MDSASVLTLAGSVTLERSLNPSESHAVTSAVRGLPTLRSVTLWNSLKCDSII